ncbi:TPA: hypothetical protein ACGTT2_004680, partial [Vibrio parahaemolyticus]
MKKRINSEKEFVDFVCTLSGYNGKYKQLLLASPFGCRNPEFNSLLVKRINIVSLVFLFFIELALMLISPIYSVIKLSVYGRSIYYKAKKKGDYCIVMSDSLYKQGIENYIDSTDIDNSSEFRFSYRKRNGMEKKTYLNASTIVRRAIELNIMGIKYFSKVRLNYSGLFKCVLIIKYLTYVNRLSWTSYYNLRFLINDCFKEEEFRAIYYPHEMFSESIVLWEVFSTKRIKTITIQHTTISRGKLYYFRDDSEWELGLKGPDVFIVNTEFDYKNLKEFFPRSTNLIALSSPRIKSNYLNKRTKNIIVENNILLITTGTWFEVRKVLLFALNILLFNRTYKGNINIRLHPFAKLSLFNRCIRYFLSLSKRVCLEHRNLDAQLEEVGAVIGCGTTLLYELAISGENVRIINDDDFYYYHDVSFFKDEVLINGFNSDVLLPLSPLD